MAIPGPTPSNVATLSLSIPQIQKHCNSCNTHFYIRCNTLSHLPSSTSKNNVATLSSLLSPYPCLKTLLQQSLKSPLLILVCCNTPSPSLVHFCRSYHPWRYRIRIHPSVAILHPCTVDCCSSLIFIYAIIILFLNVKPFVATLRRRYYYQCHNRL